MLGTAAPLHAGASCSLGKEKPSLERGEEKRVQAMDARGPRNEQGSIDFEKLHEHWYKEFADIFGGVPPGLPPLREVNHRIPLIDKNKQYHYHLPRCPDAMKPQLLEKMKQYTDTRW